MIHARQFGGFPWIALALLSACAPQPPLAVVGLGPAQWAVDIDYSETECTGIEAVFSNRGQQYHETGRITEDGLLAEHVFGRRLRGKHIVQFVEIHSDTEAGWLNATLKGRRTQKIGLAVSCQAGWHSLVETRSGQYLGEGVVQDQFRQVSRFRVDRQGRLVARVQTSATYRTDQGDVTQEGSDNWYRFEATAGGTE